MKTPASTLLQVRCERIQSVHKNRRAKRQTNKQAYHKIRRENQSIFIHYKCTTSIKYIFSLHFSPMYLFPIKQNIHKYYACIHICRRNGFVTIEDRLATQKKKKIARDHRLNRIQTVPTNQPTIHVLHAVDPLVIL